MEHGVPDALSRSGAPSSSPGPVSRARWRHDSGAARGGDNWRLPRLLLHGLRPCGDGWFVECFEVEIGQGRPSQLVQTLAEQLSTQSEEELTIMLVAHSTWW